MSADGSHSLEGSPGLAPIVSAAGAGALRRPPLPPSGVRARGGTRSPLRLPPRPLPPLEEVDEGAGAGAVKAALSPVPELPESPVNREQSEIETLERVLMALKGGDSDGDDLDKALAALEFL